MEPVVTLEGAQKLSGAKPEQKGRTAGATRQPDPVLPLDGRSIVSAALDRDTILIAGIGDSFAPSLTAILNDNSRDAVPCMIVTLSGRRQSATKKVPFLAVLPVQPSAPRKLERVTIRSKGHSHPYVNKYGPVDFDQFLALVADAVPHSQSSVTDMLVDTLLSVKAETRFQQAGATLVAHVARRDGFVEMLGQFDEGEVYLQGWSKDLPAGNNRVFVFDGSLRIADFSCSLFERKDTGGKAPGFSGVLEATDELSASSIRSLFFRGRSGWNKIDVHERSTVTAARALPGLIRSLLPRLSVAGDGRSRLEAVAQRFDGRETVSALEVPVRVGIDMCSVTEAGGVVLSGWLFNPEEHVASVFLRTGKSSVRLDETWTTQVRPDVSQVFEDLSPFLARRHRHGVLAIVPGAVDSLEEKPYLEIVLKDGRTAYAPLVLGQTTLRSALRRLAAGLNPAAASETDMVERQILPMLKESAAPDPAIETVLDIGEVPENASRAIVIGLDEEAEKIRTLLPVLALDPLLRGTPVVLAASVADLSGQLQDIRRLATLYRLTVRTVAARNVDDKLDAIQAGVAAAPSDTIVCLNSSVIPLAPGWLEPLVSAFQARDQPGLVVPTILYEDDTIRWAGTWIDKEGGTHVLKQHYVGYPRRTLQGADSCEVVGSPFDCCVLPKSALTAAGGFSRCYLGTDEKGMDATLKLRRSGLKSFWVPQVEMVHPEDGQGGERLWRKLVSQHDRMQFERIWLQALAELKESA